MTGPERRRLIGMLVVLVGIAAVVAVMVALAGRGGGQPEERLRATGPLGGDDDGPAESTILLSEPTTSSSVATTSTSLAPTTAVPPVIRTRVAPPPVSTSPAPPAATTTSLPPPTLEVGPESCAAAAPSPITGAVVALQLPDGLHEVSLDGTRDVLVPGTAGATGPVWSADGRRLAFSRPSPTRQDTNHYPASDLVVVDPARGCSRLLSPPGNDTLSMAAWSPDGTRLAYVRAVAGSWASRTLEVAGDDGSAVTRLAQGEMLGASWAPDGSGRIAYGQDGGLRVRTADGKVIVVDGTTGGAEDQSWSPDGTKVIYTISVHQGIWVGKADGSGIENLSPKGTRIPNGIFWSRFSPDGRRIAFGWGPEIWVIDADGSNPRQVAEGAGYLGPFWTPDGDELVYDAGDGVRVVPVDGGASRLLHAGKVVTVFRRA